MADRPSNDPERSTTTNDEGRPYIRVQRSSNGERETVTYETYNPNHGAVSSRGENVQSVARPRETYSGDNNDDSDEYVEDGEEEMQDILESAVHMAEKRTVIRQMKLRGEWQKRTEISSSSSFSKSCMKTLVGVKSVLSRLGRFRLSDNSMWKIESRFGSSVASFFKFLKWTMTLNLVSLVFILALILTPQLAHHSEEEDKFDCPDYLNSSWAPLTNASDCCSELYRIDNEARKFHFDVDDFFPSLLKVVLNLLEGTDWVADSPLFYGYYSGTYVFSFGSSSFTFDFPLAYFLVMLSVLFINLLAVVISSANSFLSATVHSSSSSSDIFMSLAFCTYDYSISGNKKATATNQMDLKSKLKVAVDERERSERNQEMRKKDRVKLYALRIAINLFVLACLAGSGYMIYVLTGQVIPELLRDNNCVEDATIECLVLEYVPSLAITAASIVLPFVFTQLIYYEKYSSETELVINLSRCIFLRLASLLVAFLSIYFSVRCDYAYGCLDERNSDNVVTLTDFADECGKSAEMVSVQACRNHIPVPEEAGMCGKPICWETYLGQQFYKLQLLDFSVQTGLIFLFDFPRVKILGGKFDLLGRIEFSVSKHVLDIVYSQTICWLAVFYSPLIIAVTIIKSFLLFYFRMFYVLVICTPSSVPYSAARASAFFKYFLLLAFTIAVIVVGFTLAHVQPSLACGPYRDVPCGDSLVDEYAVCKVYDYVIDLIMNDTDQTVQSIVLFFGQTTVLIAIGFVLLMTLYFYWAYRGAQSRLIEELRSELVDLGKDKAVLLLELKEQEAQLERRG